MSKFDQLIKELNGMDKNELSQLSEKIFQILCDSSSIEEQVDVCKRCGQHSVIKYGKDKNGKQRYKCKDCGCLFSATSFSVVTQSHQPFYIWKRYIELLLEGKTLKICAAKCNISVKTAFVWRHKILNTLETDQNERLLGGVVEMDDMFCQVSYKGNHTKSKHFVMPRKSYKRGTDNRHRIGEMACVMCAVERKGQVYGEVLGIGSADIPKLSYAFGERLLPDTICISDGAHTYKKYFDNTSLELVQVSSHSNPKDPKSPPEVKGSFHIQNVNNVHQRFRNFMRKYNGVATKYLNHYLNLFIWIENHKTLQLEDSLNTYLADKGYHLPAREIFARPAIPEVA